MLTFVHKKQVRNVPVFLAKHPKFRRDSFFLYRPRYPLSIITIQEFSEQKEIYITIIFYSPRVANS